jgi:cytidine deaminase
MKIFQHSKTLSDKEMFEWLKSLRHNSYAPASNYMVSSVLRTKVDDQDFYFGGVNCENIEYSLGTHGEDGAISSMITALGPHANIEEVWTFGALKGSENKDHKGNGSCCGRCRQRIAGFGNAETVVHNVSPSGEIITSTLKNILPRSFSFKSILPELDLKKNECLKEVSAESISKHLAQKGDLSTEELHRWLVKLKSVCYSSLISQSVIVKTDKDSFVAGVKIEDAAFTGINAAQASIANARAIYGDFKIKELNVMSFSKEPTILPANAYQPLTLSALQVIREFIDSKEVKINYFNKDKGFKSFTYDEALNLNIHFKEPYLEL